MVGRYGLVAVGWSLWLVVLENDLFIDYLKSQIHEKESLYISNLTSFLMTDIFPFRSQVFAQFPRLEITLTNNNDK